jgi:dTDP-4-amino-4,6-dideoxygalactose transaminase
MQRLDEFVAKRHELSMNYDKLLKNLAIIVPWQHADSYSGLHLYVIRLPKNNSKLNHLEVFERLRAHGVGVNLHYIPVYRHPYYERMGFNPNDFPEAERYYAEAVTLPMYPALTKAQQQAVVNKLNE